ncbi:hypothetical protein ABB37_08406 [Leptomonas pyrrhocoris]|uniref:Uncharacterized protein n=1 Tax=Leptomonas pyrrhocoris TaxID=157538 RepID=A0A0M9FTA8_LEPPY|nr:hypothetical protein ABB37_08406 [Leptomonas pyrrhocoris]KPA75509.1 hypothetical protein ABB37_08406 [Leptomonas pyrrhocoris]|eukprot:XP_015653948.1 hypothetical protein ABB37_08406 [Leptomonas pyrrhocoris]
MSRWHGLLLGGARSRSSSKSSHPSQRSSSVTTAAVRLGSLVVLCLVIAHVADAAVYTTALSAANVPGSGAAAANPLGGLYHACLTSQNASASSTDRNTLTVRTGAMADLLSLTVGSGTYYIAGYYDDVAKGWFWSDGASGAATQFGQGPFSAPVNNLLVLNWVQDYPQVEPGTKEIGKLKYMVYDGSRKGWINVAGTGTYDGVVCESQDRPSQAKKKFPWWAILIIVLGCVAAVVIFIVIIVRCCCKKTADGRGAGEVDSDEEGEAEDERKSFRSSRSGSMYTRSRSNNSFGSRRSGGSVASNKLSRASMSRKSSYSYSYSDSSRGSYVSGRNPSARSRWTSSSESYSSYSGSDSPSSSLLF